MLQCSQSHYKEGLPTQLTPAIETPRNKAKQNILFLTCLGWEMACEAPTSPWRHHGVLWLSGQAPSFVPPPSPQVQGAGSDTAPCRQTATATCLFLHPCGSHLGRRSSQRPRDALVPVALGCRLKAEASSAPLHQITRTCTDLPLAVFIPPMAHILHKSTHTHSHVLASCLTTEPWWHSTAAGRCSQPPPASAVWRSGAWHGEKRIKESNACASAEDYAADLNLC